MICNGWVAVSALWSRGFAPRSPGGKDHGQSVPEVWYRSGRVRRFPKPHGLRGRGASPNIHTQIFPDFFQRWLACFRIFVGSRKTSHCSRVASAPGFRIGRKGSGLPKRLSARETSPSSRGGLRLSGNPAYFGRPFMKTSLQPNRAVVFPAPCQEHAALQKD